tara:strand:- start:607 stop:816 length:210 start_codon:yes stop_codon:yes gene_type:complete
MKLNRQTLATFVTAINVHPGNFTRPLKMAQIGFPPEGTTVNSLQSSRFIELRVDNKRLSVDKFRQLPCL